MVGVRHPSNPNSAIIYVSASSEAAANALARKLPHYGRYSWLVFAGDEATNEATGEWPVGDTPLAVNLTPQTRPIDLAPRKALAEIKPQFDIDRLKAHGVCRSMSLPMTHPAGAAGVRAEGHWVPMQHNKLQAKYAGTYSYESLMI
jgi:hypothetical protein